MPYKLSLLGFTDRNSIRDYSVLLYASSLGVVICLFGLDSIRDRAYGSCVESYLVKRFTMKKKSVAVVRYYEDMWVIRGGNGERIFTANDEEIANRVLKKLNAETATKRRPKRKRS